MPSHRQRDHRAAPRPSPQHPSPQHPSAQRAAAARARIAAEQRRKRLLAVIASLAAVVAVIAVLVVVKTATGGAGPKSGQRATTASATVIAEVTSVPGAVLNRVGAGTIATPPAALSAPALTSAGKPRVLYVGAEYCPYCAAERWAVTVALSRFGTFTGLGQTASAPSDVYPNTPTLSFPDARYTSPYLSFTGKQLQSNQVVHGSDTTLDTLNAADEALVTTYNKSGSVPFIDIGGRYAISGASYSPALLSGKTHAQVAAALSPPSSPIGKAIDGTANVITAALCKITTAKPAAICQSAAVTAGAAKLPHG